MTDLMTVSVLQYVLAGAWLLLGTHAVWSSGNGLPLLFPKQWQVAISLFLLNGSIGIWRLLQTMRDLSTPMTIL